MAERDPDWDPFSINYIGLSKMLVRLQPAGFGMLTARLDRITFYYTKQCILKQNEKK